MFSLLFLGIYLVYIMFAQHKVYTWFVLGLHYDCKYTHLGMLIAFPRIQTKWIHPLTCFFVSLACHMLLSASFLALGGPACAPKSKYVNRVWTWCKQKMHGLHGDGFHVKICKLGSAKRVCNRLCQIWLDQSDRAHLSDLNKLFLGYSISSKSVFWPVLPQSYNRPEACGQAHTWPTRSLTHVVHGMPA